ncbi:ParB N-terminal domain-containing protein [Aeromicrobium sp. HA]|uniref:ParB N-terminal domain-containing protein n=1 Tax=Aeromicrobium sp. HA TaxID=3009077 RepID=UPI0022AFEB95|nr:ParB N-terminal domain-containing protein [Aeromicrobium sp. HA]
MLYQFLPRLTDDEYSSLEASIREHGIQVPILVDENKSIIDGHHRHEIAERLGIECPRRFAIDLSDEQKRTLALSLNVDRRHLTRDQRRQLITASVMADPQLSNRQHAERTGASDKTVGAVRTELERRAEIPHVSERRDSAGRTQPAAKPVRIPSIPRASERAEADAPTSESQASSGEATDLPPAAPPAMNDPSPEVTEWLAGSQELQDKQYMQEFRKALGRSGQYRQFDAERIARLAPEADIKSLENEARNTAEFLERIRRGRTGLRVINGGR